MLNFQPTIWIPDMLDRSTEIIKDLKRLANDRSLQPRVRNKITNAIQHIKDLHDGVSRIRDLHIQLSKIRKRNGAEHPQK